MTTNDKLAELEAMCKRSWGSVCLSASDVLALVEIARAAQAMRMTTGAKFKYDVSVARLRVLDSALSRLEEA